MPTIGILVASSSPPHRIEGVPLSGQRYVHANWLPKTSRYAVSVAPIHFLTLTTDFDFSASQKVLSLPELVLPTIKDLAPRDLHSAALVCHTWSGIALDYLWETAVSLAPLFNTLAPMRYSGIGFEPSWTFVTDLSQANWPRFHAYARRIRTVKIYSPRKQWSRPVSMDSVAIVQVSIPSQYHLPKPVRLLSYDPLASGSAGLPLRNFLCTVSSAIKELYVVEDHHISLDFDDAPVQDLYRRFGELETPSLESITLKNPLYFSDSPSLPNLIKRHALTISVLTLNLPYKEQLWAVMQELHNLKHFSIAFEEFARPQDMVVVLDEMTSGIFPNLETLSVHLQSANIRVEQQRIEVFKCIGRLTQLTSLKINSETPIMPYADQMWHVGHSLCQLETLSIDDSPSPIELGTSRALISILQSFPHIKRLNTSILCDSVPDTAQAEPHSSLELLDLSWSPVPTARQEDVAGFLRSILPRTARVVHSEEEIWPQMTAVKSVWGQIVRLMDEV
ncbi:hypothetical protein FRC01_000964 [Tulasnella sp. 417]|nr:hypothetical protein FRC01_000964 [Tulasnella sp. 417]